VEPVSLSICPRSTRVHASLRPLANKPNRYNISKLLQLYTAIKLAVLIDPVDNTATADAHPIVINSLDPCFCKTGLSHEMTGGTRIFVKAFEAVAARPAEEGARLVVQAASCGRETHGLYLRAGAVQAYAPIARDEKKAAYVWELLCKRLEKLEPGILENLK
jgi:retinol dehydrogenase 12